MKVEWMADEQFVNLISENDQEKKILERCSERLYSVLEKHLYECMSSARLYDIEIEVNTIIELETLIELPDDLFELN